MARLVTTGFEVQKLSTTAATDPEGVSMTTTGAVTINTATPRSGAACISTVSGASNNVSIPVTGVLDRVYFVRLAFRITALPTPGTSTLLGSIRNTGGSACSSFAVTNNGALAVRNSAAAAVYQSANSTIALDTWYVLEVKCMVPTAGNGTIAVRFNGNSVLADTSTSTTNTAIGSIRAGHEQNQADTTTVLIDDVAVNDDQGTDQNSWPGIGKVVLLKPTGDNTNTGWGVG